mgnify:CR=1 FL=1
MYILKKEWLNLSLIFKRKRRNDEKHALRVSHVRGQSPYAYASIRTRLVVYAQTKKDSGLFQLFRIDPLPYSFLSAGGGSFSCPIQLSFISLSYSSLFFGCILHTTTFMTKITNRQISNAIQNPISSPSQLDVPNTFTHNALQFIIPIPPLLHW